MNFFPRTLIGPSNLHRRATALLGLDIFEDGVGTQVRTVQEQWCELLHQIARAAVKEGHLSIDTDIEQFVWELCIIYRGHAVTREDLRWPDADACAARAIGALILRHQPAFISAPPDLEA